jgi:hypothetical protein
MTSSGRPSSPASHDHRDLERGHALSQELQENGSHRVDVGDGGEARPETLLGSDVRRDPVGEGGLFERREEAGGQAEPGHEDVGVGADRNEAGPDQAVRDRATLERLLVRRVERGGDAVGDQQAVLDRDPLAEGAESLEQHVERPAVRLAPGEVGKAVHGAPLFSARRIRDGEQGAHLFGGLDCVDQHRSVHATRVEDPQPHELA